MDQRVVAKTCFGSVIGRVGEGMRICVRNSVGSLAAVTVAIGTIALGIGVTALALSYFKVQGVTSLFKNRRFVASLGGVGVANLIAGVTLGSMLVCSHKSTKKSQENSLQSRLQGQKIQGTSQSIIDSARQGQGGPMVPSSGTQEKKEEEVLSLENLKKESPVAQISQGCQIGEQFYHRTSVIWEGLTPSFIQYPWGLNGQEEPPAGELTWTGYENPYKGKGSGLVFRQVIEEQGKRQVYFWEYNTYLTSWYPVYTPLVAWSEAIADGQGELGRYRINEMRTLMDPNLSDLEWGRILNQMPQVYDQEASEGIQSLISNFKIDENQIVPAHEIRQRIQDGAVIYPLSQGRGFHVSFEDAKGQKYLNIQRQIFVCCSDELKGEVNREFYIWYVHPDNSKWMGFYRLQTAL